MAGDPSTIADIMKLCQGQVWKKDGQFIRIVKLERLAVEYKSMISITTREGALHQTSKKDFCRLLKGAQLWPADRKPPTGSIASDAAAPAK